MPEDRLLQPLLLSRFMPGDLVSEILPGLAADEAERLGREIGATLATIGTVSFKCPGFFAGADLVPDGTEPTADLPAFVDRCLRTGNADHALTPAEQQALLQQATSAAVALGAVHGARQLVHSDFNPKNLLATCRNGTWTITAVLDWEFSFSSSPLFDIGNMLRFRSALPPGFAVAFIAGYRAGGGQLPRNWPEISQALDLFALADFLTRPPEHRYFGKAAALIRQHLTTARGPGTTSTPRPELKTTPKDQDPWPIQAVPIPEWPLNLFVQDSDAFVAGPSATTTAQADAMCAPGCRCPGLPVR